MESGGTVYLCSSSLGRSATLIAEVGEHFLKRALVDGRINRSGKEKHLLSWPFLGKIPETSRIGNRYTTDFMCHIEQVFIARDEHIGLSC